MSEHALHKGLQDALARADANAGASEAHGILCGMLCAEQGADRAAWLAEVLGSEASSANLLVREATQRLDRLLEETLGQLGDGMLGLRLLLPDDEQPLSKRVAALGAWCEGFLLGIARTQRGGVAELPAEVQELVADLVEITKVDAQELDDSQEDENSYAEVVEYVRMGVLLAFEQARGGQPAPPSAH